MSNKYKLIWTLIVAGDPVPDMHVTWLESPEACVARLETIEESYGLHDVPPFFFAYAIVDPHGRTLSADAFYNGDWTVPDDTF